MNRTASKQTAFLTLALVLSLASSAVRAQVAQVTLEGLLTAPPSSMGVQLARENLVSARRGLAQLQQDPTTLRADLLSAQGNLAFASASLTQTVIQARVNLTQAFFNTVAADRKRQFDLARQNLLQTEFNVAQGRVKVGSGTALAVEQAQVLLTQVGQDLKVDEVQLSVQQDILRNILGVKTLPALDPKIPASGTIPALDAVRTDALNLPGVVRAASAVEIAKLRLEQSQSEFTAAVQRTAAEQGLLGAQLDYQSQVALAQQSAEQAFVNAMNTRALLEGAQANLRASENAFKTAGAQERAGTVSKLQVRTLEVAFKQAELSALQARQAAYLAWLNLELVAPSRGVK